MSPDGVKVTTAGYSLPALLNDTSNDRSEPTIEMSLTVCGTPSLFARTAASESKVAAGFCRALGLRNPHHPHATVLAATTLMLVDATLRTWYRRDTARLEAIVDGLIGGLLLLGQEHASPARRRRHARSRSAPVSPRPGEAG